ncbi:MAG: 2-oxoacid:ferredoxin oxidoreductase subunit beta [Nanoarchaeota archaeon]|nr:2-oxoacid:ferredoxin oxidoreductase subunit beta [Nanoarchaeota archaeon]
MNVNDLTTDKKPVWCPGCGHHTTLLALKTAIVELGLDPSKIVLVSGIGCGSQAPHYLQTYGFHSIHGRPLPVATGVKLANKDLIVIAMGGDGDGYGIGANHFIHTMRRNIDITYITQNNQVYGLTTGQTSPTALKGYVSKTTPHGVIETPMNPMALAVAQDATYVARGCVVEFRQLVELIKAGIQHRGISLIDVIQPCVTFNKVNTVAWYKQHVYKLESSYKPNDRVAAIKKAFELHEEKLPIGLFYVEDKPTYEDQLPQMKEAPLSKHKLDNIDIDPIMKSLI